MHHGFKVGDRFVDLGETRPRVYTVKEVSNNGSIRGEDACGHVHWASQDGETIYPFMDVKVVRAD